MPPPTHNTLLAALSAAERTALVSSTEPVLLNYGAVIFDINDRIDRLYFPADSVVSLSIPLEDRGRDPEVAMVGREGFAGAFACLGQVRSSLRATVQQPGTIYTLPLERLQSSMAEDPQVSSIVNDYVVFLMRMLAQSSCCRSAHTIEQQVARWLLMFSNRVGSPTFSLTHERLAQLLGVRRASVTTIAGSLQEQGMIDYHLGRLVILSRQHLERVVCECYLALQDDGSSWLES